MVLERMLNWLYDGLRPRSGWISFSLLLSAVMTLAVAVSTAAWVPEVDLVYVAALLGVFLTTALIQAETRGWLLLFLVVGYGFVLSTIWLSEAYPGGQIFSGWEASVSHIDLNLRLYWARMSAWMQIVSDGGSSRETIVFATFLVWTMWLLACFATWVTLKLHKPLHALSLLGIALAINNFYGNVTLMSAGFFVAVTVVLVAAIHYEEMVVRWGESGVDFSDEIRNELLMSAAVVALVLVLAASVLPAVPYQQLARTFQRSDAVASAEESLERAFAGIEQPEQGGAVAAGSGRPGFFPRSFLLGNAPELSETAVFQASINRPLPRGWHWRGVTYDIYSGSGWSRTDSASVVITPADDIRWTPIADTLQIEQQVTWIQASPPNVAFTIGRPLSFDQAVTIHWRADEDLAYINDIQAAYTVLSELPQVTEEALRQVALADMPPEIVERYTVLPDDVPQRVHKLARDVTGSYDTPYEQARAIERFLRQYPYSLELSRLPPAGSDPVDYFLFELKQGYCDYYASSMVVMARSIGLPARFASGFTIQNPDEDGIQTILQINAHSWAEIYFPGSGWIEFEPTAGFASNELIQEMAFDSSPPDDNFGVPGAFDGAVPPIPLGNDETISPLWFIGTALVLILVLIVGWFVWQWQPSGIDGYSYGFSRLQHHWFRLTRERDDSLTPLEFGQQIDDGLQKLRSVDGRPAGWWQRRILAQQERLQQLIERYNLNQYGNESENYSQAGFNTWRQLRQPMWLWRFMRRFK